MDLPTEILHQIISYEDISISDQISLAQTCSALSHHVLQKLYQNFELTISYRRVPEFKLLVHKRGDELFNNFHRYKHFVKSLRIKFQDVTGDVAGYSKTMYRNGEYTYSELDMEEMYWLIDSCTYLTSLTLLAPKEHMFDFHTILKIVENTINSTPHLLNLQIECRPCSFEPLETTNSLMPQDGRKFAKLDTFGVSIYGLLDGHPSNSNFFEALYKVLGASKDSVKTVRLTVGAEKSERSCCELHHHGEETKLPSLGYKGKIIFRKANAVELGFEGPFQNPEGWLGVDLNRVKMLTLNCWMGANFFKLEDFLDIKIFRYVRDLDINQYSDVREQDGLVAYVSKTTPLLPALHNVTLNEIWKEMFRYYGTKSALSKTTTSVYVARFNIRHPASPTLHRVSYREAVGVEE
ncbi:hypothetical protein ABW20_dc0103136 [Dactylellina cionopaga]|nr:hypothetical protein ABW20_dc0103136 [Dactylellina cionopaga]